MEHLILDEYQFSQAQHFGLSTVEYLNTIGTDKIILPEQGRHKLLKPKKVPTLYGKSLDIFEGLGAEQIEYFWQSEFEKVIS